MTTLRRQSAAGMTWCRGRARFEDGAIALDPATVTEYQPLANSETHFPYELAAIKEPADAVEFARRYGLLRAGPGSDQLTEPWSEWEASATKVRAVLRKGVDLGNALRGDARAMASVRSLANELAPAFQAPASNDDEATLQVSVYLAQLVNAGLDDVGFGVQAEAGLRMPDGTDGLAGRFAFSPRSPHLVGLIYYALGLALVNKVPGRECEGCGRIFPVRDPRQRYHDKQCAQRTRQRRFAEKIGATHERAHRTEARPVLPRLRCGP